MVAILVGAWWADRNFGLFERPTLEHRARLEGRFEWQERSSSECIGWYYVKFENIGKRTIELTKLVLDAWYLDLDDIGKPAAYVDVVNKVKSTKKIIEDEYLVRIPAGADSRKQTIGTGLPTEEEETIIARIYPPNVSEEVGLMMVVKSEPGKMMVFKITGTSRLQGQSGDQNWYHHQVEKVCNVKTPDGGKP
jgi:nitrogen regulatory protein PII